VSHIIVYLAALLVPALLALLASADVRSWLRGTGSIRQTLSNAGVGVLFLLSQLLLRGVSIAAFAAAARLFPWKLPDSAWAYAAAFVALDIVYYVQHRLEHRVPVLWAIHSVHHQSVDYNLSVSFRVGMLASVSTLFFHLALAAVGVTAKQYAAVLTVHGVLLFMLHARTKFTFGPGRLFNAPVFHRVHHGADDAYIDKNFGGVFLIFDRLFGTFAPYAKEPVFGVTGESVPLNPIAANTAPFAALLQRMRKQSTWRGRLRVLFVWT
jgi:sterol desaturase/sphingolipid hydroxylase (fatty acid hydroxylase superfamily)